MLPILPLISLAVQYAPQVIGLLAGSHAAQTADKVVAAVHEVVGTADPAAAQAKLVADPALAQALAARLASEVDQLKAELGDTADARQMGLGLVEAHHWTANMPAIVVLMVFALHTAITAAIFFIPGDITDRMFQLLTGAYGTSSTAFGIALAYYLGSSRSSVQKDNMIAGLLPGARR